VVGQGGEEGAVGGDEAGEFGLLGVVEEGVGGKMVLQVLEGVGEGADAACERGDGGICVDQSGFLWLAVAMRTVGVST
jgi:hypothetical protein